MSEILRMIKDHQQEVEKIAKHHLSDIQLIAEKIINCLKNGNKLITFGNGGSATDSQHFVAELVGRFLKERKPLAALALTTNTASLTAIANDYGYEVSFSKQIEALGKRGDVAIGISTSGNSQNVLKAIEVARKMGIFTIGLLGKDGGQIKSSTDFSLVVASNNTPRVQEAHSLIIHIICELVENKFLE